MKILLLVVSLIGVVVGINYLGTHINCVKSHIEIQIKNPPSIVVGGGKNGGGIGVPLGNGKLVEVTVCDDYKWKK